jgi:hypothetical protein
VNALAAVQEPMFDGLPSLTEYCNEKWAELEAQGAPASARYRADYMAAWMPHNLVTAVAMRCMTDEARRRFRAAGMKSVPAGDRNEYRHAGQMALPDIQAFVLANHDRRIADAKSELAFVGAWCESHGQYSPADVYRSVGLKAPGAS